MDWRKGERNEGGGDEGKRRKEEGTGGTCEGKTDMEREKREKKSEKWKGDVGIN